MVLQLVLEQSLVKECGWMVKGTFNVCFNTNDSDFVDAFCLWEKLHFGCNSDTYGSKGSRM